jgi:hypothetical protein
MGASHVNCAPDDLPEVQEPILGPSAQARGRCQVNIIQQLARAAMESAGDDLPAAKALALSQARQQPEVQDALIAFWPVAALESGAG